MKLEDQVCSLEFSKKLKELGVNQHSLFYWYNKNGDENLYGIAYTKGTKLKDTYSAFTVAELAEMLPFTLDLHASSKDYRDLKICKNAQNYWLCVYVSQRTGACLPLTEDKNMANALAKMLIHLIENKLMEIK